MKRNETLQRLLTWRRHQERVQAAELATARQAHEEAQGLLELRTQESRQAQHALSVQAGQTLDSATVDFALALRGQTELSRREALLAQGSAKKREEAARDLWQASQRRHALAQAALLKEQKLAEKQQEQQLQRLAELGAERRRREQS